MDPASAACQWRWPGMLVKLSVSFSRELSHIEEFARTSYVIRPPRTFETSEAGFLAL